MRDEEKAFMLYTNAKPLNIDDGSVPYRCIVQFNGAVLAVKQCKNEEIHFVTWGAAGDENGHYFETDFRAAIKDFLVRAELD